MRCVHSCGKRSQRRSLPLQPTLAGGGVDGRGACNRALHDSERRSTDTTRLARGEHARHGRALVVVDPTDNGAIRIHARLAAEFESKLELRRESPANGQCVAGQASLRPRNDPVVPDPGHGDCLEVIVTFSGEHDRSGTERNPVTHQGSGVAHRLSQLADVAEDGPQMAQPSAWGGCFVHAEDGRAAIGQSSRNGQQKWPRSSHDDA
jgi:hypothetical protein